MINALNSLNAHKVSFSSLYIDSNETYNGYLRSLSIKNKDTFKKAEENLRRESEKCGVDVYMSIKTASQDEQNKYLLNEDGCMLKAVIVRKADGAADIYENQIGSGDSSFVNSDNSTSLDAKAKNKQGIKVLDGLTKYIKSFVKAEPLDNTIAGPVDTAFVAYDSKFA